MTQKAPWSASEVIPVAAIDSREPAIAMIGETLHLVWNHNRMLYHAWCSAGAWSQPTRVAIGEQPVLAAAGDQRQWRPAAEHDGLMRAVQPLDAFAFRSEQDAQLLMDA